MMKVNKYEMGYIVGNIKVSFLSPQAESLSTRAEGLSPQLEHLSPQTESLSPQVPIPIHLQNKIEAIGKRITDRSELEEVLVELCKLNEFTSKQLASVLSREEKYLIKHYLRKLLKEDRIQYAIPKMITHPNQKYKAGKNHDQ